MQNLKGCLESTKKMQKRAKCKKRKVEKLLLMCFPIRISHASPKACACGSIPNKMKLLERCHPYTETQSPAHPFPALRKNPKVLRRSIGSDASLLLFTSSSDSSATYCIFLLFWDANHGPAVDATCAPRLLEERALLRGLGGRKEIGTRSNPES